MGRFESGPAAFWIGASVVAAYALSLATSSPAQYGGQYDQPSKYDETYDDTDRTYTETFYLSASGDASAPETIAGAFDASDFNTSGNWAATVGDDGKIGPGDRVIVLDDDGPIRAQLAPSQSGLSGNPITLIAEGGAASPVVTGSDLMSTWESQVTLLSDNFDDNDITDWSNRGGMSASGGQMACATTGGTDDSKKTFTAQTEVYASWKFTLVSGYSGWANNEITLGSAIQRNSDEKPGIQVGISDDSGTKRWYYYYGTDAGTSEAEIATYEIADDTQYTVTTYQKIATGAGQNDGIYRIWVDGGTYSDTLIYEVTTVDSDTLSWDTIELGNRWSSAFNATMNFDDMSVYTALAANQWSKSSVTTQPKYVRLDGTYGTEESTCPGDLNAANEWCWDSNTLYVYSTSDPDTAFTDPGIEAVQRDYAVALVGDSYIRVVGLELEMANAAPIVFSGDTTGSSVEKCEIHHGNQGVATASTTGNIYVLNNTIHDTILDGMAGKHVSSTSGSESIVRGNTIYSTSKFGMFARWNYYIIEWNTIYSTGTDGTANAGINVVSTNAGDNAGQNNILRYNLIYNNVGSTVDADGILIDNWSQDNQVYYNIIYGNEGRGITAFDTIRAEIYNNTLYGNCTKGSMGTPGEILISSSAGSDLLDDVTVKNNIGLATSTGTYAVYVNSDAADETMDIDTNIWYRASGNWWYHDSGAGSSLATWNGKTGVGTDLNSDPGLVDASSNDFQLRYDSPAIDTATDVSLSSDYARVKLFALGGPDIGAYEYVP